MKTIQLNLYSFEELDEKAKQIALAAYFELNTDYGWWDYTYDDFITICGCLGVTVDKKSMAFEGFYSQGDGSGFNAEVDSSRLLNSIKNRGWRGYAPKLDFDFTLPTIDKRVLRLVTNGKIDTNPKIIKRQNSYAVVVDLGVYPAEQGARDHSHTYGELDELEKWFNGIAQTLNRFLFKQLQQEYEYQTSDEALAEVIEANDYHFLADGSKANAIEKLVTTKTISKNENELF